MYSSQKKKMNPWSLKGFIENMTPDWFNLKCLVFKFPAGKISKLANDIISWKESTEIMVFRGIKSL